MLADLARPIDPCAQAPILAWSERCTTPRRDTPTRALSTPRTRISEDTGQLCAGNDAIAIPARNKATYVDETLVNEADQCVRQLRYQGQLRLLVEVGAPVMKRARQEAVLARVDHEALLLMAQLVPGTHGRTLALPRLAAISFAPSLGVSYSRV